MTNSNEFQVRHLSDPAGKDFLRGLLQTGRCVPFVGAGFTAGESAHRGLVPDGVEFTKIMRDAINASATSNKPTSTSLESYSFQQLADEYFREPIVNDEIIKTTLRDRFTRVSISSEAKKAFLRWDWEYVYTLNIDDAIENELGALKVLPFTEFSQHKTTQFVYKLHGDAADAVTAKKPSAMKLVFGSVDYINSLISNRALISTLANDLAERHLIFVGCSLTQELDILFALAHSNSTAAQLQSGARRVYVTASEPVDYESKKKLRQYGITDVLIVDYADFYSFVASVEPASAAIKSPLDPYAYPVKSGSADAKNAFLRYLLQIDWSATEDAAQVIIRRDNLAKIGPLLEHPIVVIWGRRFSGKTAILYAALTHYAARRRYFVPSSAASSDTVFNAVLRAKDALIAVDTGAMSYQQLQTLVRKIEQIRENKTTVVLASSRAFLSALGPTLLNSALEISDRMSPAEAHAINLRLEPYGLSKQWRTSAQHLDNIFALSDSPVIAKLFKQRSRLQDNIERLHHQWSNSSVGKLEFSVLFYLGSRQRIYSRYFRELANAHDLNHLAVNHFSDFAKRWEPFIELDDADPSSQRAERSMQVMVANANAWMHFSVRRIALRLGATETSAQIVRTFEVMNKIEDKAFELLLFDNLNAIFAEGLSDLRVSVIKQVYERLAVILALDPDYWLQRAKSFYYLSNDVSELQVGVEYCDKSIVKKGAKTNTNAKLTKANLLGKICKVKKNPADEDFILAIQAYVDAIESRPENPLYIDELLRKSQAGKSYMSLVCRLARRRASLLPHKSEIEFVQSYISGRF